MKFKPHRKNMDGTTSDKPFAFTAEEHPTGLFDTADECEAALKAALTARELLHTLPEYVLSPYDDSGVRVEKVSDKETEAAFNDATWLVANNREIRMAVDTMIAARRLNAFAVTTAEALLQQPLTINGQERVPHHLTIEVLLQSAMNQVKPGVPFGLPELFASLAESVLPWMQPIIEKQVAADQAAKAQRLKDETELRRGLSINVEYATIKRERPLVLVGYGPAVKYLLDIAINTALTLKNEQHPNKLLTVIRWCDHMSPQDKANDYLVRVPKLRWEKVTGNEKRLAKMVHDNIIPHLRNVPDLLVVDDLAAAGEGMVAPRGSLVEPLLASAAAKRLKKWMNHSAMGLLAGMPFSDTMPPNVSQWSLAEHADIVPIVVTQVDAEHTRITLRNWEVVVPDSDLAVASPNKIIL